MIFAPLSLLLMGDVYSPAPALAHSSSSGYWECPSCNYNEKVVLRKLQERGIRDRNALATVMGNIKQESTFVSDICEGGARTSYYGCTRGGFGLIQWTSESRYRGLGQFANRYGGDPSSLSTQVRYMTNEPQWKRIERYLKAGGRSIAHYMNHAFSWLGWGHHGSRTDYAYNYANRLVKR